MKKMCKPYKELNVVELKAERLRLKYILSNHPKPNTYKQAKKSLERVEKLLVERLVNGNSNNC